MSVFARLRRWWAGAGIGDGYDGPRPDRLLQPRPTTDLPDPGQTEDAPSEPTAAQADAVFVAVQAKVLEEALALVDTGAMSRRGAPGDRVQSRPAVLEAQEWVTAQRVRRLEWVLRSECTPTGCIHPADHHHPAAEAGVSALFPTGAFAS